MNSLRCMCVCVSAVMEGSIDRLPGPHLCPYLCCPPDQESCTDNNAGCTDGCIQGPFGAQCTCPVGFQLTNDSKTCEDIDECQPPGLCSQHCFNERGSFRCHCQDGYTLEADQRTCKVSGECVCVCMPVCACECVYVCVFTCQITFENVRVYTQFVKHSELVKRIKLVYSYQTRR